MNISVYLVMQRLDNSWMAVPGINGSDRTSEINKTVAINILQDRTVRFIYKSWNTITDSIWNNIMSSFKQFLRSEERRVGKECRSLWWAFKRKHKKNDTEAVI